jgi:hypothetical protein
LSNAQHNGNLFELSVIRCFCAHGRPRPPTLYTMSIAYQMVETA